MDFTPLKLSVICFPYFPSKDTGRGHDRYVFEIVENLKAKLGEFGVDLGVIEQGFSKGVFAAGSKLLQLGFDLLSEKADVYHAICPMGGAAAVLFGKKPLVVTVHDLIPFHLKDFDSSWKYSYVRFCARLSIKKSAAIIVPYRVTKDEIVARLGGDAAKVHVVNYGVDHATYYPRPELTRATNRVLYIGEVSRSKGVDVLIKAFEQVKKNVPDAELVIGGKSSKDQPMLEELATSLGVRDLTFQGFIPEEELATYYSTTTVMVFPSRYGFGLSVLEAMACGTPVVAAAALDAPEFVEGAGILVKPDDVDSLATSITQILTDAALRTDLTAKGIAKAKSFSWENAARGNREVYERVRRTTV